MPKELYHFKFSHPHYIRNYTLYLYGAMAGLGCLIITLIYPFATPYIKGYYPYLYLTVIFAPLSIIFIFRILSVRKSDNFDDEFIVYDNGWFAFWSRFGEGWLAPARLDWIYPEGVELKPLHIKNERMHRLIKKKNGMCYVGFGLEWAYPEDKWKNWVFRGGAEGWMSEDDYKKLLQMIEFLNRKGRENLESERIKIPDENFKQRHTDYYTASWYWNEVFKKENMRELYERETGEGIPEPIRSFMYDYGRYKELYLKHRTETGEWIPK